MDTTNEIKIYEVPPIEVFDRYHRSIKLQLILNYHCKLAAKSNYLVSIFDNERGYCDSYYTTADLSDIYHHNGYLVKDCNWNGSKWHSHPFIAYFSPLHSTVLEEYFHERTTPLFERGTDAEIIGRKFNGQWEYKFVNVKRGGHTEFLTYDFKRNTFRISDSKAGKFGRDDDGAFYESFNVSNKSNKKLKKLEGYHNECIKWFIEKLSQKKYHGFYDDVIERLKQI